MMTDPDFGKQVALGLIQKHLNGEELKAPKLNVNKARSEYRMQYEFKKGASQPNTVNSNITSNGAPVFVSENPFCILSKIGIKDLILHLPAKGSYLLLRCIEPPILVVGIMLFVEDQFGRVIIMTLYNFIDYDSPVPVEEIIPVGTVLVIKEPFLKLALSGQIVIRCDCPTDVIIIDQNHPMHDYVSKIKWKNVVDPKYLCTTHLDTAVEWKEKGNKLYNERNFRSSLEAYFAALKMSSDPAFNIILQLNICAAYLELGCFEDSINYTKLVLQCHSNNVKAIYRAGRSHYSLRQFSEALTMFQRLLKIDPSHKNGLLEEKRCSERLKEKQGTFDVYKLYLTSLLKPGTQIDFGEYIGPIEIAPTEGKGHGVVATQNIKPGTYLLVSKAFQATFDTDLINSVAALSINCDYTMDHGNRVKLLAQTCQAVMKNPNIFGHAIYSLTTGDAFLDKSCKVFCDSYKKEPIADADRLRKILNHNCFSLLPVKDQELSFAKHLSSGSGLFIYASKINHSCIANAVWKTYNDVIVIRSVKLIRKGDEITINYTPAQEDFMKKEKRFSERGFTCTCVLCRLDRSEPRRVHQKRTSLESMYAMLGEQHYSDVITNPSQEVKKQMNKIMHGLEMAYSQRSTLKIKLFDTYMKVARNIDMSLDEDYPSRITEVVDKALGALGLSCDLILKYLKDDTFSLPEDSLVCEYSLYQALILLIHRLQTTDNTFLAKKWANVLVKIHHMFTGGNVPMLISKFKDLPEICALFNSSD